MMCIILEQGCVIVKYEWLQESYTDHIDPWPENEVMLLTKVTKQSMPSRARTHAEVYNHACLQYVHSSAQIIMDSMLPFFL